MAAIPHEVLAVAATVWDQDRHSPADLAFLAAIAVACLGVPLLVGVALFAAGLAAAWLAGMRER